MADEMAEWVQLLSYMFFLRVSGGVGERDGRCEDRFF